MITVITPFSPTLVCKMACKSQALYNPSQVHVQDLAVETNHGLKCVYHYTFDKVMPRDKYITICQVKYISAEMLNIKKSVSRSVSVCISTSLPLRIPLSPNLSPSPSPLV